MRRHDAENVFRNFSSAWSPLPSALADERASLSSSCSPPTRLKSPAQPASNCSHPIQSSLALLGVGLASLAVLVWMIVAGPGYLGYGAALLWAGQHVECQPLLRYSRHPRRRFGSPQCRRTCHRPADRHSDRQSAPLRPLSQRLEVGTGHHAAAAGRLGLSISVSPDCPRASSITSKRAPLHSRHFNIRVVDLPGVKQIRVTYRYPVLDRLQNVVDEHGGDLRAVEGTRGRPRSCHRPAHCATASWCSITASKSISPAAQSNVIQRHDHMDKDGAYHVAAIDQGSPFASPRISSSKRTRPTRPRLQSSRPGRDYRASPIEEVTVSAKATDEFGAERFVASLFREWRPRTDRQSAQTKGRKRS